MIPVYQPSLNGNEKKYVNQCLDSTWISSRGEFISRFEQAFSEYIGAEFATTVCNGTVALHLALQSLGIGPGDEVIVPTLTYIASVNTILQTGAQVVYADSLLSTWNVDVEDIRRRITAKTKAVMVVHLYGLACDMDALVALCKEQQLLLIEDCAEAFGSRYHGQHVGTFGDAATFSFFGNKTITTGEGGMVVCKNALIHERASSLKTQGVSKTREYWHEELAYNYRMTNICAAIGLAQLEQADTILAQKRGVANWYRESLAVLPLILHAEQPGTVHSFWMCSVLLDDAQLRQPLREHLNTCGIVTRPLFPPAHTMPHCFSAEVFPHAENLSARGFNLPSYPALTQEELQTISSAIRNFFD
jgi:perosamine synthetase